MDQRLWRTRRTRPHDGAERKGASMTVQGTNPSQSFLARRSSRLWPVLVVVVVTLVVGLGAGYVLFGRDGADVNAEVREIARVEAFLDAWADAWETQDVDAAIALMTEDGMAYGYRADEDGVLGLAFAAEERFEGYTFEASDVILVRDTLSTVATGGMGPAYDVVEKVAVSSRDTGEVQGRTFEYYHIITDDDGLLRLHHASVLNWTTLRSIRS